MPIRQWVGNESSLDRFSPWFDLVMPVAPVLPEARLTLAPGKPSAAVAIRVERDEAGGRRGRTHTTASALAPAR